MQPKYMKKRGQLTVFEEGNMKKTIARSLLSKYFLTLFSKSLKNLTLVILIDAGEGNLEQGPSDKTEACYLDIFSASTLLHKMICKLKMHPVDQ